MSQDTKQIDVIKLMQAYAAQPSKELRSALRNVRETPYQTDTVHVSNRLYSDVLGIITDVNITDKVKIISRKRMLDIARNFRNLTEKINNFPCVTTGNVTLNIIWNYIDRIVSTIRKWVETHKDYTMFRNTNNELMFYINSDIVNLIREFECFTGITVGFFEDSFRKRSVSVIPRYATRIGLVQQMMYVYGHDRASHYGRINAALLFAPRSNDNKHIYLNRFFEHEMKRELNDCEKYLESLGVKYGEKDIDIEDKEKYTYSSFVRNMGIHTLQNPEILFDENGDISNIGVKEMQEIEEYFFDENYDRVIEMLSTYALPYDSNCIQSVLSAFKTIVDEAESLEEMAEIFCKKIEYTSLVSNPEYQFLKETLYEDAETVMDVWQYTQDYIFGVYVGYLYAIKDDSIEQVSIKYNIENLLENGIIINNCDEQTKLNTYNPYGEIVEDDTDENKPDDDWCDDDCHLCSARKRCPLYAAHKEAKQTGDEPKDDEVNIEHLKTYRFKDGTLKVYHAKAGKDTNISDVLKAFFNEIKK